MIPDLLLTSDTGSVHGVFAGFHLKADVTQREWRTMRFALFFPPHTWHSDSLTEDFHLNICLYIHLIE